MHLYGAINIDIEFMGTELVRLSDVKESLSYSDRLLFKAIEELKGYHQGQIGPFQWQRRCNLIIEAEEYFNMIKNDQESNNNG